MMKGFIWLLAGLFTIVIFLHVFDESTGDFPRKKIWDVTYENGFCLARTDYVPDDTCRLIHETDHAKFYNLGTCKPCYDIFDRSSDIQIECDVSFDKDVIYYLHNYKEEDGLMVLTFLLLWPEL